MWHGASWTFLTWGLFHGGLLVVERIGLGRLLEAAWAPLRHAYTLLAVMVGWTLFRAESLPQALAFLQAMVGFGHGTGIEYHPALYIDNQWILALIAGVVGSMPVLPWFGRIRDRVVVATGGLVGLVLRASLSIVDVAVLSLLLLASSMLLAAGTHNPFIYFRF
jgi:alginate O-acetyltransferase complex protein AlgI